MPMRETLDPYRGVAPGPCAVGGRRPEPGAAEEEIAATERSWACRFPRTFEASFRLHDGQCGGPWLMWGRCELLSLSRIREEWNAWKELLNRGDV